MRKTLEEGDLADVLAAEEDEARERKRLVRTRPDLATDGEFAAYYGKPNAKGQYRIAQYLKRFIPASFGGGGDHLGELNGKPVFVHDGFAREYGSSKNACFILKNNVPLWRAKVLMARDLATWIGRVESVDTVSGNSHKSNQHRQWQIEGGWTYGNLSVNGTEAYFVFTNTKDGRLLLYDLVIGKERGPAALLKGD